MTSWNCIEFSAEASHGDIVLAQLAAWGMRGSEETPGAARSAYRAYFDENADVPQIMRRLRADGQIDLPRCCTVAQQDWNAEWRKSVQPVRLCAGVWVSPAWRPPQIGASERWIRIEAKMAFGTGHHESTRLAAEGIVASTTLPGPRRRLLDIGTGSGVLCFCAALHGFDECVGLEIDPDCRQNLAENATANPGDAAIRFLIGGVTALKTGVCFDAVVMNMIYNESAPLLGAVSRMLAPRGLLLWSGILAEGSAEACDAAARAGLTLRGEKSENEWWMGVFGRRP